MYWLPFVWLPGVRALRLNPSIRVVMRYEQANKQLFANW